MRAGDRKARCTVNRMSQHETAGSTQPLPCRPSVKDPDGRRGNVMVIECGSCAARFLFDRMLFKGAGGASVRCRRCGGTIEIRNPDFPVHRVAPEPAPAPPPRDDPGDGAQPAGGVSQASADGARPDGSPGPSRAVPAFPKQDPKEVAEDFEFAEAGGQKRHRRRRKTVPVVRYVAGALAFLFGLAAVFWYFRSPNEARAPVDIPASSPAAATAATASGGEYEFDRVETFYQMNQKEGRLFVLRGRVSRTPPLAGQGRVRVRVSVRSAAKGVVAEKTVLAGTLMSDEVLLRAGRNEIEQAMSDGPIGGNVEAAPRPGGPLPFQAVFFGDIGPITSYELAAAPGN